MLGDQGKFLILLSPLAGHHSFAGYSERQFVGMSIAV